MHSSRPRRKRRPFARASKPLRPVPGPRCSASSSRNQRPPFNPRPMTGARSPTMSETATALSLAPGSVTMDTEPVLHLSMQQALNRALDEILSDNPKTVIFGEDCGRLGGVFRIPDGLQAKHGEERVFDTPLAESAILGMSVGLAMAGFHPIPE